MITRMIRFYQRKISPMFPARCRYAPTCSQYALEAIEVHGSLKGTLLAVWRLLRCNPRTKGGVDRVPPRGQWPKKPLGYRELLQEEEYRAQDSGEKKDEDNS